MKIKFNPNLDFQQVAISSIKSIFKGQEICQTNFTVTPLDVPEHQTSFAQNNLGIGNRLRLLDEDILKNVQNVQLKNGLAPSEKLGALNFTIEMETGQVKRMFIYGPYLS